ncbi:hypothetical protein FDECE_14460 [Fusarium decemcellulare]|nr:hypothetical protein FDECE_14460 [Fusarium decemcellulare]
MSFSSAEALDDLFTRRTVAEYPTFRCEVLTIHTLIKSAHEQLFARLRSEGNAMQATNSELIARLQFVPQIRALPAFLTKDLQRHDSTAR